MLASALPVGVLENRTRNRSRNVDSQRKENDSASHRSETRSGERPTDTMTTTLRFSDNTTRTAANLEDAISLALVRYPDLARETEGGYTAVWATVADCEDGAAPVADIIEAGSDAPADYLAACKQRVEMERREASAEAMRLQWVAADVD